MIIRPARSMEKGTRKFIFVPPHYSTHFKHLGCFSFRWCTQKIAVNKCIIIESYLVIKNNCLGKKQDNAASVHRCGYRVQGTGYRDHPHISHGPTVLHRPADAYFTRCTEEMALCGFLQVWGTTCHLPLPLYIPLPFV